MHYLHLFFVILCGSLCIANIGSMVYYCRKFPFVIILNGIAAVVTGIATLINYSQL